MTALCASTILLVEDDEAIRMVLTEFLRGEGYEVVAVADGGVAISFLRQHEPPPDALCLVILDMMLPVADGVQVMHALAGLGNYVPVVAMSADRDALGAARTAGAETVISKPFDLDQLLAVAERNCRSG
jgi:CheY-like chemotaxis protein